VLSTRPHGRPGAGPPALQTNHAKRPSGSHSRTLGNSNSSLRTLCDRRRLASRPVANLTGLAREGRGAERGDAEAGERSGDDCCALSGGEDLLLEAERDDGGRDAELRGRDQGSRRALVAQPGGEEVSRDIKDEQGDRESQDRRMVDQRTELQPGAEDDEEQRDEEPVGEPRTCLNSRLGPPSAATSRPVPNPAMSTLVPLS
jgi:hypothetical protein